MEMFFRIGGDSNGQGMMVRNKKQHDTEEKLKEYSLKMKKNKDKLFNSVYDAYATKLYRVCLRLTGNEKLASKVFHQVMVDYYVHLDEITESETLSYLLNEIKRVSEECGSDPADSEEKEGV